MIIATTRFFRDPYKAGVPKSTPVEQKDARPGSMVDQIVGRSDTTMRNTNDTTSIDIDVLHRIAQDWYARLRLHEIEPFLFIILHSHPEFLPSRPSFVVGSKSSAMPLSSCARTTAQPHCLDRAKMVGFVLTVSFILLS